MLLNAGAVVVGASVILFDPIFQGLVISLMAGEIASLLLSRMAVPILYFLDKTREAGRIEKKARPRGPSRQTRIWKRRTVMNVEKALRGIAGTFLLLSVALTYLVSPWFLVFTGFIGLNLLQSAFTDWRPMVWILQKAGLKRCQV
jgi:hypothetical protein